jgi:hypothetical protein
VSGATQAIVIGPVPRLDLTWDAPTPATRTDLVLAAEGRYDVRIEERVVTTQARVTLRVLGGTTGVLSLLAPATAEVTPEGGGGADGSVRVERPKDPKKPVWTIRREPSADDLVLSIYLQTDIVPGKPVEVQVFPVAGASQQRGQLTVGWPTHLRLTFKPTADLTRRDGPNETSRDAFFEYYRLPESGTLLEVEVQPARGEVETLIGHQLTLAERGWRWQGKIEVRPVRTEVTVLDFDIPAELQELRPSSAELVESITPQRETTPGRRLVRVQLAEARRRSFSFTLEGLFPFNGTPGTASLPLPRSVGTMDRGGQVSATVSPGLELRGSLREWEGDRPGDWEKPLDPGPRGTPGLVASMDRSPARVDLSWRSPRNDTPLTATVDVQLGERQAAVRYQWRIPPGAAGARQFLLRGPAALAGRLRVEAGGVLTPGGPGEWSVQLPPIAGRDQVLTLAAGFPLPAGPDRPPVSVPLLWPQQVSRCETTVRVWSGVTPSGSLVPVLAEGPWTELPPQAVPDQPSLPALVLNGVGPGLPLMLRLLDAGQGPGTSLVVERIWAQALVDEDGHQAHRARCALRPLHTHYLDVELPAPPAAVQFAAVLDGKRLGWQPVENRAVRLRIDPDPARPVQILELTYTLLPARIDPAQGSHWQTALRPPRFRGPVFVGPIRWQIALPGGDLPFFLGDGAEFEQRWGWQRGLFTPQPAWSAGDLRQWFVADARPGDTSGDPGDRLATTLVGWQVSSEPLRFVLVPRPLALLGGSLAVVILGLLVGRWAGSKLALLGAGLLVVVIVVLGVTHPQPLGQVLYAVQPGVVVLTVLLVTRRLLRGRYRRQVLLMPGFERTSPNGSSLARGGGVVRSRREPTTIDAPASS